MYVCGAFVAAALIYLLMCMCSSGSNPDSIEAVALQGKKQKERKRVNLQGGAGAAAVRHVASTSGVGRNSQPDHASATDSSACSYKQFNVRPAANGVDNFAEMVGTLLPSQMKYEKMVQNTPSLQENQVGIKYVTAMKTAGLACHDVERAKISDHTGRARRLGVDFIGNLRGNEQLYHQRAAQVQEAVKEDNNILRLAFGVTEDFAAAAAAGARNIQGACQ